MRLVAGDPRPLLHLEEAARGLFAADINGFIRALIEEVAQRRARFGETPYLLEPNIKSGEGGLRDVSVGLWAAKARYCVHDFEDLVRVGGATQRQVDVLMSARALLLDLRTALHLWAGRKEDRLTFQAQEALAPKLLAAWGVFSESQRASVSMAVEELMRRVYLASKGVRRETERLLERALVPPRKQPTVRKVDGSFVVFEGKLSSAGADVFRERPSEMLRLFRVALDRHLEIYGHTLDLLADIVAETPTLTLRDDPEALSLLMDILADPSDAGRPSMLERIHELGILSLVVPEFGPLTCRAQHDIYHVYTVDQHSLYVVACLKALMRRDPEYARAHPVAVEAALELGPEARRRLLVAALLHDVGKALGRGHAEKGAPLAASVARRLGLGEEGAATVHFLVRHHLLLAQCSQRRDIDDPTLIAQLAHRIRDRQTLAELYVLTFADIAMVAPGNLTEWKATLLRDLYLRVRGYLRSGPDLAAREAPERLRRRQRAVAARLGEPEDAPDLLGFLGSLPDRYFLQHPPARVARHVLLSRRRATQGARVLIDVRHHRAKGYSVVTVCADDVPGLLANIAGVFVAHGIHVHSAHIHSRETERGGEALDVFVVHDGRGRAMVDQERWRRMEADLDRVVGGELDVAALIAGKGRARRPAERFTPRVPTEVSVDNDVSRDYTVVDVFTQDRLGVLYVIAKTVADEGLDIHLSKIATEAERVMDAFYVRDRETRAKLVDDARQRRLVEALQAALEGLESIWGERR